MSIKSTCRDINQLTPLAQKACNLFLSECRKSGLNVCITETYRSQERQNYLYQQGRTRAGNIVTWTLKSRHTSRMAWDICKNVKGAEYSDSTFFNKCGAIAKKLGITWGGTWKTPDKPHFEISADWKPPQEVKTLSAFKDTQNHWADKHIEKLKKAGIVNGHSDGTFKPDEPITRAECAVMIANVLTYIGK